MRLRGVAKVLLYGLTATIGLVLVLLLAVKLLLDRAPRYQAEIKQWFFQATGYHVAFARVAPAFRWYGPELYFEHLELRSRDDQRVLARAAGGRVSADIWQLLRRGRLLAGHIEVDAPALSLSRLGPQRFSLAGELEVGGDASADGIAVDRLPTGTLSIRHGVVTVKDWNEAMPELQLREVNLELRHERALALSASAQLPEALGGELTLRVRGESAADGRSFPWSGLLRLRDVSLAGWHQLLPDYLNGLESGSGTFNVNAAGKGADIATAELDFAARKVSMQVADAPPAHFEQITGSLALTHREDRWSLSGRRMHAAPRDPESSFDAGWRYGEYGVLDFSIRANYLRAETLLPLAAFLPQKDVRDELRAYAPSGEWTDTLVVMNRADSQGPWHMQLQAKFRDAGVAAVGRTPGMRGLNGSFAGSELAGHVELDTDRGVYNWPAQFPQPIALSLKTTLYWRRDNDSLLVATPGWQLKTPDIEAHGLLAWSEPADGSSPVLTLVGKAENGVVPSAKNYLPRGLIAQSGLDWLNRAFLAGRLTQADLLINGPVRRFPFRDGSGLFLVRANLKDLTLDYAEHWAPAEELSAVAEFRNEGMTVRTSGGHVGALPVEQAEARFADFRNAELRVKASARGDAAQLLGYLRATPLDGMAEDAFSQVEASGALEASCDLFFPFRDFARRRTLVHGHLTDGTIGKTGGAARATQVTGDFDVDGAQVAQADLHGRLLGGPFQLQARAPHNRPVTRTQLELRGTLSAGDLRRSLQIPESLAFSGDADWRAVLKMASEPVRERSLRVSSTLAGIDLRLPAPLNKPAGTPIPSYVEVQWPGFGGPQGMFALGSLVSGSFSTANAQEDYRLTRLTLNFGEDEARGADPQILNVGGTVERVDLAGWLDLNRGPKGGKPLAYYLRQATLNIAELDYLGLAFRQVHVTLGVLDSGLRIAVGGPYVSGTINVPNAATESWNLQFDRLRFEVAEREDETEATAAAGEGGFSDPRAIPPLNFHASALIWGERRFGDVHATLTRLDDGVRLQALTARGQSFNVEAAGDWRGSDAGRAHIAGSVSSTDVQSTLKDLGYADVLEAKTGKMSFDLNWTGPPTARALAGVNGQVELAFDKGQIVGIKPGAGRVLGLTSIATLPRRLALDFSDLTDKGLAFDTVHGDFQLRDGNAYTDNVLLKGPAAEIGLIGRVGLKNRDYDQTAVVTGSLPSSLPLAALAGGPVVAGAVLVFTQVFKQPLRGLTRGYYRITGAWDNPSVERIKGGGAAAATAEAPR